jgi:hypothetical protein
MYGMSKKSVAFPGGPYIIFILISKGESQAFISLSIMEPLEGRYLSGENE